MTDRAEQFNSVALLRNVSALVALIKRVDDRDHGLPGMATFYGPSGYGKTTAATFAANEFQAFVVQVKSEWRGKFFCQSILRDMGLKGDIRTLFAAFTLTPVATTYSITNGSNATERAELLISNFAVEKDARKPL